MSYGQDLHIVSFNGSITYPNSRRNGPSVIRSRGTLHWYEDGEIHREGGPAFYYAVIGRVIYYLRGKCSSLEEHLGKRV